MLQPTLTVTDLRQFEYCPRVVYFTYVQPLERPTTYKMEHGINVQEHVEELENRRTLHEYALDDGTRQFDVWLESRTLGLRGRADLVIIRADAVHPVEFKHTRGEPQHHHVLQLAAYATMAATRFQRDAPLGFIWHLVDDEVWRIEITDHLLEKVKRKLRRIRKMINGERFPSRPSETGKCTDCEFRRFCGILQ